jgi:antirestriction protein ArdC
MTVNDVLTEKIITSLKKGTVPWHKPWIGGRAMNAINKIPYSGINALITACNDFKSPFYLTANQCKKINARWSGKATPIMYWSTFIKTVSVNGKDTDKKFFFNKYYNVWNLDQIVLPENFKIPEVIKFDGNPIPEAEKYLSNFDIENRLQDRAFYRPMEDKIYLPLQDQFENIPEYYSTAFHECGHATGHASRLNRDLVGYYHNKTDYAFEELIAELTACFTCNHLNLISETLDNSTAYCQSWIKALSDNPSWIVKASSKADKAFKFIIGEKIESYEEELTA